jgi:glycosyltransferase involved in cell wall biosynthesis
MKILVVHNHYRQPGGEQMAVMAQIALLRQQGHEVLEYTRHNREIDTYGVIDKALFFPRTVFSRPVYRELLDLARRERPDVAHLHNVFPLLSPAAYAALHSAGVPMVQTIHNFRLLCPNGLFFTHGQICERCKHGNTLHAVRWRCYRHSRTLSALYAAAIGAHRLAGTFAAVDRFIALTEFAAAKLGESGVVAKDRISVLGNFLPDPLPEPGARHGRSGSVVFLGRIAAEKGVVTLVEAAAQVPEVSVKILGEGPDGERCRALAQSLGTTNVQFLGTVTGEPKWAMLREALAVVVPSLCYEQLPFTILESMAAGTAIVASRHGGLATLVQHRENGLLFTAGDSLALARQLRTLAREPERAAAMGENARQTLEGHWSARAHYAGLLEIYALARARR